MFDLITKNFARSEFGCKGHDCCGKSAPIDSRLVLLLQAIRNNTGHPVSVLSGFRCKKHNATVPGASINSYHTLGMAADITCPYLPIDALHDITIETIKEMGYGFVLPYPSQNFLQVDIRDIEL